MTILHTGVVGTSLKDDERRVPIHPAHIGRIAPELRARMVLQRGYGAAFGVHDDALAQQVGGLATREQLLRECDLVILAKPLAEDLASLRAHTVLWGWPHCVQQQALTQAAIDRRLTLIAFESMYLWTADGTRDMHVFARNNELAGYCAVLEALRLMGVDGHYGRRRRAVILSFGSVGRGAAYALQGRGCADITFYTQRPPHFVRDKLVGCHYRRMQRGHDVAVPALAVEPDGRQIPMVDVLAEADIIVNGILQDTDRPLMYMAEGDETRLKPGSLIVDVSCDAGMGFPFARPTSFQSPMIPIADSRYYAVDHTPSYLWDAASWEISDALLPFLATVMSGPEAWQADETVSRAIDVRDGVIQYAKILSFQNRAAEYPHAVC